MPVTVKAASLIDSGSSDTKAESVKTCFSISFSMCDDLAKSGTEPVTPAELDVKVLRGRAITENRSKLSGPSFIIDKS